MVMDIKNQTTFITERQNELQYLVE